MEGRTGTLKLCGFIPKRHDPLGDYMRSVFSLGKLSVSALSISHGSELLRFQRPPTVVSTRVSGSLVWGKEAE